MKIRRLLERPYWQLAVVSGIMIGVSYPPLKLGVIVYLAFIPLIKIMTSVRPGKAARLAFLAGLISNTIALYWLAFNSGATFWVVFLSLVGAVVYLSAQWSILASVVAWFHSRTGKGLLMFPFLWVTMEYFQSFGLLAFPWISLATTQADYLAPIQLVEFTGIYGLTFWIVLLNTQLYRLLTSPAPLLPRLRIWIAVVLVLPWIYGYGRMLSFPTQSSNEAELSIAVVQPNMGPHEKWDRSKRKWVFEVLDSLYVEAAQKGVDMVVWPESAVPTYLRRDRFRRRFIQNRVEEFGVPLFTGALDFDRKDGFLKHYNSIFMFNVDGSLESYYKIHLVPLAEYNPLDAQVSLTENLSFGHYDPGTRYTDFFLEESQFAGVICYESSFPKLVHRLVSQGARFLIVVVNDGWFGNTSEPYQHVALSRLRAVEHRMPVLRSANTGISVHVDKAGRFKSKLDLDERGIIYAGFSPSDGLTFYGRFGDLFAFLITLVTFLGGIWIWHRKH
ncbi:MAG: apolipoprotein N-acyltransferase [Candidatus Marinimicrobia bacterium]|jgi:apolipoprotein N-acyltransferase|nr:apolipoprotein N-acyltransferase [Candidatus Neomarinimicrobiota bacterium]MDP7025995.1 apolipoprotein N-acyltransferase [Candidatus Neomarinimicrobiota bacterium]|tara:strand:+ start:7067 stop:8572 length:1506 start_codon:yes stop_codon:yes gene_type:complete